MDQGQLSRYRDAILGGSLPGPATNAVAATPDLAGTFANIQALGNSNIQGSVARHSTNAFGGAAKSVADQDEANQRLALQEAKDKADAVAKERDDMLNPSKYRQEIDEQGGYKFFDPKGEEIDVKQFSAATGKHITDVLKKSQNPGDQQFVQDYGDLEDLGKIMNSGDKKQLDKFYEKHPEFKAQKDKTFGDIVKDFRSYYPKFFNSAPAANVNTDYANKTPASIKGDTGGALGFIKALFGG